LHTLHITKRVEVLMTHSADNHITQPLQ